MTLVLADVVPFLACPHCQRGVAMAGTSVRCGNGHVFDVARQGYVSMLPGGARPAGDTPAMAGARAAFLATGHFGPLARQVADCAAAVAERAGGARCIVDAGAGTGFYLTAVLDRLAGHRGLALDVSKHAARRAARAHPRIGAVVADVRRCWPVRDSVAGVVLNVFAPRHAAQMHRVAAPGGAAVVVTPSPGHLRELVDGLGLITVDAEKRERLERTMGPFFRLVERRPYQAVLALRHQDARLLAGMGPSAWHLSEAELRARSEALPDPARVTLAVEISVYLPLTARSLSSWTLCRSPGRPVPARAGRSWSLSRRRTGHGSPRPTWGR
jgi:23S rRNA (guanine745-N1)-methyltransferase